MTELEVLRERRCTLYKGQVEPEKGTPAAVMGL
jgi:hypothetical protein